MYVVTSRNNERWLVNDNRLNDLMQALKDDGANELYMSTLKIEEIMPDFDFIDL